MTTLTMQETERRTGLTGPTLRYYEEIGLIGPIARDGSSGHRRFTDHDVDSLQALSCLRAMGVGVDDMRAYIANRARGRAAAGEQRDLLARHAHRVEAEITRLQVHLRWLEAKTALWDARDRADAADEAEAAVRVHAVLPDLEAAIR